MTRKSFFFTTLLSVLIFNTAYADDNKMERRFPVYLRLDGGVSVPISSFNSIDYNGKKSSKAGLYGVGIGYIFNPKIRVDITLTKRNSYKFNHFNETDEESISLNQDFSSTSLMVNVYYTLFTYNLFSPYISFGVGASQNESGIYSGERMPREIEDSLVKSAPKSKQNDVAWAMGGGTQIKLLHNLDCDFSYKYVDLGQFKKTKYIRSYPQDVTVPITDYISRPGGIRNHEFSIGLIYNF